MKDKANTDAESNTTPEPKVPLPDKSIPEPTGTSTTHLSHCIDGKSITSLDEISLTCFACYLEHSVKGAVDVLDSVIELVETNGDKASIKEGVELAFIALYELLQQINARPHGKGLPKGTVPVRQIPFVVK